MILNYLQTPIPLDIKCNIKLKTPITMSRKHSRRQSTPASGGYHDLVDPESVADYEYGTPTQEPEGYFSYGSEFNNTSADMAPTSSKSHRQRQSSTEDESQDEDFIWSPETGAGESKRRHRLKMPMPERIMVIRKPRQFLGPS